MMVDTGILFLPALDWALLHRYLYLCRFPIKLTQIQRSIYHEAGGVLSDSFEYT
jgi:hypothetical protein